jgi:AcrR family transcriptional regulator
MDKVNPPRRWTMSKDSARAHQAETTRRALIVEARRCFGARGYHVVGVRDITAAAGMTRGALAHHFGGKEELFLAVFDEVEREVAAGTAYPEVQLATTNAWDRFRAGVEFYLDAALRADVQRITLIDGPAVLGWSRWRALEEDYYLGMMVKFLQRAIDDGAIRPQPVETLAHMIFGSVTEAALMIAHSEDAMRKRAEVRRVLDAFFAGLERPLEAAGEGASGAAANDLS